MSKASEIFAKILIETVMMNAVDFSVSRMNSVDDNEDDDTISGKTSETHPQNTQDVNLNISQILQQVAQLAENLREDMKNIQIGDYVVSMNTSPLEIQVKKAIHNYQVSEIKSSDQIIATKGEGDGEHQDVVISDKANKQASTNKNSSNKNSSCPFPSSSFSNTILTLNTLDSQLEADQQLTGGLKTKKNPSLSERIRRAFRFSFSRRKNS